jgi:hypothetical protein
MLPRCCEIEKQTYVLDLTTFFNALIHKSGTRDDLREGKYQAAPL